MKKFTILLLMCFLQFTNAEEFCVTTSAELNAAMLVASVNAESDHIKIATGSYLVESGFLRGTYTYNSTENFDLEVSGGWSEFFNNPCGQNLGGSSFQTNLNGDEELRVMSINTGMNSDIKVSGLTFSNGKATDVPEFGAGLFINMPPGATGDVIVERNSFINNHAFASGALRIVGGNRTDIKNNILILNESDSGFPVMNIAQSDGYGVFAINNTIVLNTGGAYFNVDNSSQAMIVNNIFWDNEQADLGLIGTGFKYLRNNNIGTQSFNGNASQTNADIRQNNISSATDFEAGLLNFTPTVNSQMVGNGTKPPFIVPVPTPFSQNWFVGAIDNAGNTREQGNRVDIGAVESTHQEWVEIPIFKNGFDLNK